jgi:predicted amidophosphoribosyltransferase
MKNVEVKDRSSKLEGVFTVTKTAFIYNNILLFDDIFESGSTAGECVKALKSQKTNIKIFLLTLTKTRRS